MPGFLSSHALFLPLSMENYTEEKEAWRKHSAWNAIHATDLPFCCRLGSNLVLFSVALYWRESSFSNVISVFSEGVSLICISNFLVLNKKYVYSTCRCWWSLGLSLHAQDPGLVMRAGLQPATSLSFPVVIWKQLHCWRSRLCRW